MAIEAPPLGPGSFGPLSWQWRQRYGADPIPHAPLGSIAPFHQGDGVAQTSTGAALTIPWPYPLEQDDIGFLIHEASGENWFTPFDPTINDPLWTLVDIDSEVNDTTGSVFGVWWKRAQSASEPAVVTSTQTDHQLGRIITFRNAYNVGSPINALTAWVDNTPVASVTIPDFTTTHDKQLCIFFVSRPNDSAATNHFGNPVNAGLTGIAKIEAGTTDGNGGGFSVGWGVKAVAGAVGTTTQSKGTSTTDVIIAVALSPQDETTSTNYSQTVTDAIGITDSIAQAAVYSQTATDPIGIVDSYAAASVLTFTDVIGITDSYAAATMRALIDPVGIVDSIVQAAVASQTMTDPIGIVDSYGADTVRPLTDPIGIVDLMTQTVGFTQTVIDPFGITDSYSAATQRPLTDPIGIVDLTSQLQVATQIITEAIGILDSYGAATVRPLTDAVGILDSIVQNTGTQQIITDPIGIVDSYSAGQVRTLVDALGLLDSTSQVSVITQTIIDAVGLIDSYATQMTRLITDPVGISDAAQVVVALARSVTDLLGILDSTTASTVAATLSAYWGVDMTP